MKNILPFLLILLSVLFFSCKQKGRLTNKEDYSRYLSGHFSTERSKTIKEELDFWKGRFRKDTNDIVAKYKYAGLLKTSFELSGDIGNIDQSDSLLRSLEPLLAVQSSDIYRSLAALSITQHRFREAQSFVDKAFNSGDKKYFTTLIAFDVAMELGNTHKASQLLNSITDKNSFEYLIRKAKYEDHVNGDLGAALSLMEQASEKVDRNQKELYLWVKSNLADMYSHNNDADKAYNYYLEVLAQEPSYHHALKGIAWLAYSYDKDADAAKSILYFLRETHPVPDYDLLLAEIADYEMNEKEKEEHLFSFLEKTKNGLYGDMYNKYLFSIYTDEISNMRDAARIAEDEMHNRMTPETASWQSWYYYRSGNLVKAVQILQMYVEGKCYEPEVLYRMGQVYADYGDNSKAKAYLSEAGESKLELGPVITYDIQIKLQTL